MSEDTSVTCQPKGECESPECVNTLCKEMGRMVGCFRYLQSVDLSVLHRYMTVRHMEKEEYLWEEGDDCAYVAFVVNGQLKIKKGTEFKGKDVIVGVYGSGAVVGELCVFDNSPRHITAVALEDTDLLMITIQNLNILLEENPQVGNHLLKGMLFSVSARLRKSMDRLASMF